MHNKKLKNPGPKKSSSPILTNMLVKFYVSKLALASRCKVTELKNRQ
jgi:hypothetical protein